MLFLNAKHVYVVYITLLFPHSVTSYITQSRSIPSHLEHGLDPQVYVTFFADIDNYCTV